MIDNKQSGRRNQPPTPIPSVKALAAAAPTISIKAIARDLGMEGHVARQKLRRAGYKRRGSHWLFRPDQLAAVIETLTDGGVIIPSKKGG
jgi:hypothetical protein